MTWHARVLLRDPGCRANVQVHERLAQAAVEVEAVQLEARERCAQWQSSLLALHRQDAALKVRRPTLYIFLSC